MRISLGGSFNVFSESAEFYDQIYSSFKNYSREARDIAALLGRVHPHCRTILDVACGTGEHARLLAADYGFRVDGLDLNPAFARLANIKHPTGRFYHADMIDFHLGQQYDAIVCLFSSIGYARTLSNVRRALACFREHLAPAGLVIVEPWFSPGVLDPARADTHTVELQGLRIVRVSHLELEDRLSRVRFDYEIHEAGGVRYTSEVHELGLFTTEEMLRSFLDAGLVADHDPQGLSGRGMFVARLPPDPQMQLTNADQPELR